MLNLTCPCIEIPLVHNTTGENVFLQSYFFRNSATRKPVVCAHNVVLTFHKSLLNHTTLFLNKGLKKSQCDFTEPSYSVRTLHVLLFCEPHCMFALQVISPDCILCCANVYSPSKARAHVFLLVCDL